MAGRSNLSAAKDAMAKLIANDGPLPAELKDHELKGDWKGYRELHVGGDFLLIYRVEEKTIYFTRIGIHADLFEE